MTVRVKICGITSVEDAGLAVELGASAIGLVFWPGSPRLVDVARAKAIVSALPPYVEAVGVFVDQPLHDVARCVHEAGLTAVQLHGDEHIDEYVGVATRLFKAIPVRDASAIDAAIGVAPFVTVLLDAHDPVKRGGTGRPIDWSVAAAVARHRPVVLSGGLHAGNVSEAIGAVRPAAIDVSSGVEASPGRKDPAKLRAFFAALPTS